jgi:hypothetical protein
MVRAICGLTGGAAVRFGGDGYADCSGACRTAELELSQVRQLAVLHDGGGLRSVS